MQTNYLIATPQMGGKSICNEAYILAATTIGDALGGVNARASASRVNIARQPKRGVVTMGQGKMAEIFIGVDCGTNFLKHNLLTAPCYSPIVELSRLLERARQMAQHHAFGLLIPICYFINVTSFLRALSERVTNPLRRQYKDHSFSFHP